MKRARWSVGRLGIAFLGVVAGIGCHPVKEIVPHVECFEGDRQLCYGSNKCPGNQICGADQRWGQRCENVARPTEEVCDGVDNDCNGVVDDNTVDTQLACGSRQANGCGLGTTICKNGAIVCNATQTKRPEACNGVDDDCDGVVDNNMDGPEFHPQCSTTTASKNYIGACRPGFQTCENGREVCRGEVKPQARNCFTYDDFDCNGKKDRDESPNRSEKLDIVLFLDESGSMEEYFPVVRDAIRMFAAGTSMSGDIKIAAVGMPHGEDGKCALISNFDLPANVAAMINNINVKGFSYSSEPTIDCPFQAAVEVEPRAGEGWVPRMGLKFRDSSYRKAFVSFSDERVQTYFGDNAITGSHPVTSAEAGERMRLSRVKYYSFDMMDYRYGYSFMTQATGGRSFDLNRTPDLIKQDLVGLFNTIVCGN